MTTLQPSKFHQETITQLHLNRARFLRTIIGLSDSALELPIWDDYSVRRILPHIARWDGFEAERLSLIKQARLDELIWTEVDERNAVWHAEHADISAEVAVALLQKERNALLNVLADMPDDILQATVTLDGGFELPVLSCVTSSIEHDANHAEEIAAWRAQNELSGQQNGSPAILLAALKATRKALRAMLDLIGNRPIMVDEWDCKQILAHIAGWEQNGWDSLQAGEQIVEYASADEANAAFVALSAEKSLDQVWQQYEATRRQLEQYVATNSAETLSADVIKTSSGNSMSPYRFICLYISHDVSHLDELYGAYLVDQRTK